jgi:hypothetical protein
MVDIRQSIISLDSNFKTLITHYDDTSSSGLKSLNEQLKNFEKRWTKLIDDLEQCSNRVRDDRKIRSIERLFSLNLS